MAKVILLVTLYGIIPGIQSVLYMIDLPFVTIGSTVNYVFSIFTYYAVFNHLLISVKIPRLQSFFPYDRMVRFHALSGILLALAIYYHGAFKFFTGKDLDASSFMLFFLWTILLLLAILWIDTPFTRNKRAFLLGKNERLQKVSYDLFKGLHEYLFILFAFISYIHINESDFLYSSYSFITVYGTYFPLIVISIVVYARVRRLFLPKMSVVSVRNEAETLVLTLEAKGKRKPRYRAGQFGYLKVFKKGVQQEDHPFSFLSNPHEDTIMLGIKALGDFTRSLQKLQNGDTVRINGGFGNFVPQKKQSPLVFIGSGIGIVPLVSLIRDMRHIPPGGDVDVFLAVNVREELLFEEELTELAASIENLKLHTYIYTEDGTLYTSELFREEIGNPEHAHYFLCSSPGVRKIVTEALIDIGVKTRQIHFEAFSY